MLKYAREGVLGRVTCGIAVDLECLKYAHEHGCRWDEWTCRGLPSREGTVGVFEVRARARMSGLSSLRHGAERSLYTGRRRATRRRSRAHVPSSERRRDLHARIPAGMERARRALSRGALESCSRASTDVMIAARRAVYALISHRGDSALMATPTSTDARMTSPRRSPSTRSSCHSNIAATLSKHPMTYWSMRK